MSDLLIIDKYTGEQCKYVETEMWYDNTTPMDDSLCDHVVYIQHEHKYYKRVLNDYITVKMYGAIGDGLTDDSEAIQKAVDFCERTSQKTLFFPPGNYLLNTPVENSRGGVKFIGSGALLREESWWNGQQPHSPFSGCSLIIPQNSSGFVFKNTVTDPIFIESIQFLSKEGRIETTETTPGTTYAIDFKSEFNGPTWPFIVRDCHFRGFNRAISFKSVTAYNVAFVQITGCAFSQNDECVYFGFADDNEKRNLCWGFVFENNKCHDNARTIYGKFAKDLVRIVDNNFEGSTDFSYYIDPQKPKHYAVDIEISNCTVQFFGNHFETMKSNAVYISSLPKNSNGDYISFTNTTALSNQNKVEISGNNTDGMAADFGLIEFDLSGLQIINKDTSNLYIDACEIVENLATSPNIFLNKNAKKNGTIIKFSDTKGSSYLFDNTLNNLTTVKAPSSKTLYINGEQYDSFGNKDNSSPVFFNGGATMTFKETPAYLGAAFKIDQRLGNFASDGFFSIFYQENNIIHSLPAPKYVKGMLSQQGGEGLFILILPAENLYPSTTDFNGFSAGLTMYNLQEKNILIATDITYFTIEDENPKILPYYQKSNIVEKVGTFEKGQTFVDTAGNLNVVKQSGTIDSGNFLTNVTASGTNGKEYLDSVSNSEKFTIGQYIKFENLPDTYRIVGCENGTKFYLNKSLTSNFSNSPVTFSPPTISVI
ncbi:hypothetical protein J3D55_000406 [Chryseobacterium ginsenosidimutans]|uniref:glycoside hydrolase family 55 protein n=1 Tax=Chryseobacterium ginsenosidimutans TaxID=687846 RepID=UPI00216A289E|nr:glycoside hydrolase family 55 protein [Chryseobacterium ginsenosidimutans]MCS3867490.1 hypothetical protein [Chryseobacterium ginsenosidimutans]